MAHSPAPSGFRSWWRGRNIIGLVPFCQIDQVLQMLDVQWRVERQHGVEAIEPLALVPIGTLCQAENCSIFAQVAQRWRSRGCVTRSLHFFAASNTSARFWAFGNAASSNSSLLIHITWMRN